ncbi:MAG: hypothetical protein HY898_21615 [Deltaproteobacteria bacterium]|nr:hypothetical protein [Deltaproteobacteria bacterium]
MRTSTCDDPRVLAAVRDKARGRRTSGSEHVDQCEECSLEVERLRRLAAVFEQARPSAGQIEGAWRRFDEPSAVRSPRAARIFWAFAAAAVVATAVVVWMQLHRAPKAQQGAPPLESVAVTPDPDRSVNPLSTSIARPAPGWEDVPAPSGSSIEDEGERKARRMLEPRVWSGKATIDEVRMLKAICRHQKDAECVARANQILSDMSSANPYVDAGSQDTVLDEGERKARLEIEQRLWSGKATIDEVKMLKAICRHQKDAACVERASKVLEEMRGR